MMIRIVLAAALLCSTAAYAAPPPTPGPTAEPSTGSAQPPATAEAAPSRGRAAGHGAERADQRESGGGGCAALRVAAIRGSPRTRPPLTHRSGRRYGRVPGRRRASSASRGYEPMDKHGQLRLLTVVYGRPVLPVALATVPR